MAMPIAEWMQCAAGRPEWQLWGKAQPGEDAPIPGHPLLCHMIDVLSVARLLVREVLPTAERRRLLGPFGIHAEPWIAFVVALHDLGKATPPFQKKWTLAIPALEGAGFDIDPPSDGRDHGVLSVPLAAEVLMQMGIDGSVAFRLARAVGAHHGSFPSDGETTRPAGRRELGKAALWGAARAGVVGTLKRLLKIESAPSELASCVDDHAFFLALAGLTAVADWIGSMAEIFEYVAPPSSAEEYLVVSEDRARKALARVGMRPAVAAGTRTFHELFDVAPWPLHQTVEANLRACSGSFLLVVEAPMGEGKTEAALYAADCASSSGQEGFFIGLPTQATANQMFSRVERFLHRTRPGERANLHLAHGESILSSRYGQLIRAVYDPKGGVVAEQWFTSKKRTLLATYAVGTVDQALLGVLRVRHGFVRLYGLAGKTVVVDEVHAYDTYTSELVDRLIAWLHALGASVVLLSATLPSNRRAELVRAFGGCPNESAPYPRMTLVNGGITKSIPFESRRSPVDVAVSKLPDDHEAVACALSAAIEEGGCAGWICNTVARAQKAYSTLARMRDEGAIAPDTKLLLLHARFVAEDRARLEEAVEKWLGPPREGTSRPERCIVIGTQVLEQSLDIDFDVLATDVAPIDLVLQRLGRLYRHVRPARPPRVSTPTVFVVCLELEESGALRKIAGIYDELIMRRTLALLGCIDAVVLPRDIEPFVERVYVTPPAADAFEDLAAKRAKSLYEQRTLAKQRVLPPPTDADDPFASLVLPLEEDNPELHKLLRADTRLGEPSVDVVCLFGDPERPTMDAAGTIAASPSDISTPARIRALLCRNVGISTKGLTQALVREPVPPGWAASSLMRDRRLLVFGRDGVVIGQWRIRIEADLGIVIERMDG